MAWAFEKDHQKREWEMSKSIDILFTTIFFYSFWLDCYVDLPDVLREANILEWDNKRLLFFILNSQASNRIDELHS